MIQGLRDRVADAKADPEVKVLVLTGAGDKAFCAGADLTGMRAEAGYAAVHDDRGELARLFDDLWNLGKPTIARVRGYCLAGGLGLALSCDLVVAADDVQSGTQQAHARRSTPGIGAAEGLIHRSAAAGAYTTTAAPPVTGSAAVELVGH